MRKDIEWLTNSKSEFSPWPFLLERWKFVCISLTYLKACESSPCQTIEKLLMKTKCHHRVQHDFSTSNAETR